jgi:hypothetical protein
VKNVAGLADRPLVFEFAKADTIVCLLQPRIRYRCNHDSASISFENSVAKNQQMTYTFLHASLPLLYIHRHLRLDPFHFPLPVRELQPPVLWVTPPACRDSKRWQVDICRRVTASGGVIDLICHKTRPAPGLESRTSFPLCTYMWNRRETRRVWHLTAATSFCIAYVSLPPV